MTMSVNFPLSERVVFACLYDWWNALRCEPSLFCMWPTHLSFCDKVS